MKKFYLLLLCICALFNVSFAQCLTAGNGQYPAATFTPACLGAPETITTAGFAGEYSMVNVVSGNSYVFSSSLGTDFLTISNSGGTIAYVFGTTPVAWTATFTGTVRFYTHTNAACGEASVSRSRIVQCSLPPCVVPANQATNLVLTPVAPSQINGSFTAAAGSPSGYLTVRYLTGATVTSPVNGTTYTTGNTLGAGKVVSSAAATTFNAIGLTPATTYDFYVYSYNNTACAGPIYKIAGPGPLAATQTSQVCAPLAGGTYTVGPTGTYASLTAVAAAFAGGTSGPVVFELQSTYLSTVETFPITFSGGGCVITGGAIIRPQTGAVGLSVSSANATGTINFDGASNITFDGRAGGVGVSQLSISNTNVTGYTIQLINSSSSNTFKYCTIAGVNTGATSGVIVFSNAVGLTTGNSNNIIDNCDIRDGATTPTNLIYVTGNTTDYQSGNNNNTVSNCLLHDWFNASSTTTGMAINIFTGASDWTITGNSFYQTVSRTFTLTTATNEGAVLITASGFGVNFTITNNFFGGSAPLCAGTAWTYIGTGTTGTPSLTMLRFSSAIGTFSNITGNTFSNIAISTASTNTFQGLIAHLNGNVNINNNTIGSQSATGNITYVNTSTSTTPVFSPLAVGTSTFLETMNVTNNNIGGITVSTTSTGTVGLRCIYAQPPLGSVTNISNNTVGGTIANSIQNLTGSATAQTGILKGINVLNPSIGVVVSNNTIRNLTSNNVTAGPVVTGIDFNTTGGAYTISNNTISNLTTSSTNININNIASITGIVVAATGAGATTISGNTVFNLVNTNTTVAGWINGMYLGTAPAPQQTFITKNNIHSISLASNIINTGMTGILFANTGAGNITNNFIRLGIDATGASITTQSQIIAIYEAATGGGNVLHNTVYVGGTGATGATVTYAYAKLATNTVTVDSVMNNIFINARSNASGTSKHYAMGLNAATGLFSNYNDLVASGTGGVLAANLITTAPVDYATLPLWRAGVNQDWNSISADPNLVNPTGTSATVNLHINAAGPTPIEQAGYNLAIVPDDIDGQARAGLTPVDLGADAGNFTVSDIAPPVIYLTPLLINTCSTLDRAVNGINITDATGVPTSGTQRPRIYYRKNATAFSFAQSQPGTLASGTGTNGVWNFNIVASDMGGLVAGDVVSYYIVAQDIVATPNLASNPGGAISATNDVNNITTHPTTPNTYTINGVSLTGTYTVGAGGNYTTLTAAVAAYNSACLTGPVVFNLTDAVYAASETFPISINANPFASATNTLTIKPTLANTTITGTSASALIVLNGADWVTLNGSASATNNTVCPAVTASRDLTITNTNVGTATAVIWLQSTAAIDPATNNSIRNINLVGSGNTQTFAGVGSGSSTISTASLGVSNNNNSYVNNNISKTQYGIFSQGQNIGNKNQGTIINQNLINTVSPNNVARGGILVGFENGILISGNNISEISLASSPDVFGIAVGGIAITTTTFTGNEVTNGTITKNIIGSVRNTGNSFSACGIFIATAFSGTTLVANNTISGVSGNPTPGDFSVGLLLGGGSGSVTMAYYNTITMTNVNPLVSGTSPSYALAVGGSAPNPVVDLRNNILVNYQNNGSGNNYAIGYGYTSFNNLTSDHNDYYVPAGATFFIGATGSLSAPTNQATIANLQSGTTKDANAQNVLPTFVSATDLHLSNAAGANWCLNGTGAAVSVTDDMDCQVRNNPPDIGADEFVAVGTGDIATPASQTRCPGAITPIVLSGGATSYTWTRDNTVTVTGIAASGTGNISGNLNNTTNAPVTVTFTITAFNAAGCAAPATFTATVLVNPTPVVNQLANITVCNGAGVFVPPFSSPTTGGTIVYNWQNFNPTIGLTGFGTGNILAFTATNVTSLPQVAMIWVTPSYTNSSVTCPGPVMIFYITVNPTPSAAINYAGSPYCSDAGTATVTQTGTTGGVYSSTGGLSLNSTTGDVTLGTSTPGTYTVTYTIGAAGGCAQFTTTASITITAAPSATISYAGSPYCTNAGTATVTRTGTAGGTYSSTAGLTINAATGEVTLGTSTPGTYTVTYTVAAAGGCALYTTTTSITITAAPAATISYAGSPYCANAGTATVTQTGSAGGTYSSTPGLTINTATGAVTLGASIPGTYTVTYTVAAAGGCALYTTTTSITITAAPAATISYAGSPYCSNAGTATVTQTGSAGGTYSSTPGLTINTATGAVTLGTSIPGTYTVTYTVAAAGGCALYTTTTSITITAVPSATISYAGSPYCSNAGTTTVTQTGTVGGTYSSTAGLTINAATGDVTLGTSTAGTYTVTYTIAASGGCPVFTTTASITITAANNATIAYTASPYCTSGGTATVTQTGTAGGTYSSTAGLTLNAANGDVTLGTSTPGTYTVTYSLAANGPCPAFATTTNITINNCNTLCLENFDGVTIPALPTGWTATTGASCVNTLAWRTVNTSSFSPPNSANTNDPNCISDEYLDSRTYEIAAAASQLVFRNSYNLESGFDGMVLEISINGGAFADIITAGGTFATGGYNGTISVNFNSPIAGRQAWTGNSGGFITTTVNLPGAAQGQNVVFRWRRATDQSVSGVGVWIDDVYTTPNPTAASTISYTGSPYCSNAGTATVTRTGTAGGTYSSTAGLTLNAANGDVTLGTSTPGTYTVTYTYTATGGCPVFTTTASITITVAPSATISYAGSPYCQNAGTATVTRTGTAGGTYSSTAGLTINAANGDVTLGTSTPGTYTVTYTIAASGGCAAFTTTASITITALPAATISYAGSPYCSNGGTATVTRTGTAGGTYSSTAGLTINVATGDVTLGTSTPGTYTVTYTIAASGGCGTFTTTASITITAAPAATISYAGSPYCANAGTATVTRTGTVGGTYSSTAGLTLNAANGDVTLGTSTPGTYTVTYTIPAAGGCAAFTTTASITITALPAATISYAGSPYCSNAGTATVTRTGTAGGTYSSTAGLTLNAATGDVTLGTSTAGTYTVTYTIAAAGGCPAVTATTTITITTAPSATISYAGSPYCSNAGTATVTRTGTAGGTYSSTAGLTLNATTGDVTLGTSTPGTYTVTYTIAASGGCPVYTTTTTITITAPPSATIAYTGSPYCQNAGTANVTRAGTAGGTYSSTAGLTLNATTGAVTLGTSTPGTYTVTYTIAASGGCPVFTTTATITITATPSATISYAGSPYCSSDLTAPVTRTGTAGGTYSSTAGLAINAATGTVTPNTSTPGTYTVTYTIAASGGCGVFTTTTTITITQAPNAIIFYAGTPYCQNGGTATVTRTGTAGGTYSSTAGLTLNAATGAVTLGTSTPGTYTVTYTIPASGGCGVYITTTTITITTAPSATIAYTGSPYCQNAGTANVTQTGTTGGIYSSTAGLTINAATGAVTLGTSTPGIYTVTYTIAASGGCATFTTTTTITITALPAATISYAGSPYCQNAGTATVTRTGTAGGTYSSTAGLSLNAATGDVTLATSTAGTYTVTYTLAAGGGCPAVTATTTITITALPAATISYAGNPYCQNGGTATVTRTGTAGGTYSATPGGLTINAATGTVTLGTSTPGTYTVTYTLAAGSGCPAVTATTSITVNSLSVDPAAATASPAILCGSGTVTLSVTGGSLGTGGTWKWYTGTCGGTLVGTGATLNVTVSATTLYFVRGEGACNTTICASVLVTVNAQPTITIAASPVTVLKPFMTTTLTATVSPAAGNTIVWYRNGVVVPGATGLTLVVNVDALGQYTARATTAFGCTALSNAVTITAEGIVQLFITPNPNNGQFKVRYYTSATSLGFLRHLVMYSENGQMVFDETYPITAPYSSMDVDARRLPKGIYVVMLTDAFGKEVLATGKVVIQ